MSSDTINIYWAGDVVNQYDDWGILYNEPETLFHDKIKNMSRENGRRSVFACPAFKDLADHTLVIRMPISSAYTFIGDNLEIKSGSLAAEYFRSPHIKDNSIFKILHPWTFFADQPVIMTVSSPYFHHAPHMDKGALVPGRFDVGQWFRSFQFEMNLWDNVQDISFAEGEPIAYVTFSTDKKIALHRFQMTPEISKVALTCSRGGDWEPKVPLIKRYNRFRSSRMSNYVLSEIKKNLIK